MKNKNETKNIQKKFTNSGIISFSTIGVFLTFLLPSIALAVDFSLAGNTFKGIIIYVLSMIYIIIPILVSIAFIVFFWGLSKFIIGGGNEQEVKKGKEFMLWGILALFILISIRSILGLIAGDLEIGDGKTYPLLPTTGDGLTPVVESTLTFPEEGN